MKYDLKTKNLTFKQIKYIKDEILTDIRLSKWKTLNWQLSVVYIVFLYFFRMFSHYIGQYFACLFMGVPVTKFDAYVYKINLEYAAFELQHDLFVILAGVLFNSAEFVTLFFSALISKKACKCFPRIWYMIICWYGVYVFLDPILILVIDTIAMDSNGDWFKLYNWYVGKNESGIVGIYLTFFLMFSMTVFNGFLLYYYMIYVHMNGRILDLYKRLSGSSTTFFIPKDQEVSLRYLQWVVQRVLTSQKQDFIIKSEDKKVFDKVGKQHTV